MESWITGTMIQRYVEERFSTYTQLMDMTLEMREDLSQEDRILARFSNFSTFTSNIESEVYNIFKVKVELDKREHQDYYNLHNTVFETHIMYNNVAVGHYGFSIEQEILDKYERGFNYGKLN